MTRILGVLGLLIVLYTMWYDLTADLMVGRGLNSLANIQGRYGIITLGAALVIITGGIDLSLGSVVGCGAILFGVLITKYQMHPYLAVAIVVGFGVVVGVLNGLLVTRMKLQPFLVTLCGMFIVRGVARMIGGSVELPDESTAALDSLRYVMVGKDEKGALVFPATFCWLIVLAAVLGFFLHRTAYGRYWYAIGYNEQAARYSGVNVNRHRLVAYVVCSALGAFAGVMLLLDSSTQQADNSGAGMELYAILGAVLGGCSLRGGEGTAIGMVLGAMVLPVLEKLISAQGTKNDVIPAVIGLTLLFGTIVDELIRRRSRVHK